VPRAPFAGRELTRTLQVRHHVRHVQTRWLRPTYTVTVRHMQMAKLIIYTVLPTSCVELVAYRVRIGAIRPRQRPVTRGIRDQTVAPARHVPLENTKTQLEVDFAPTAVPVITRTL